MAWIPECFDHGRINPQLDYRYRFFGMFSGNTRIKLSDDLHISVKITRGIKQGTKSSNLSSIVQKTQRNRNIRALGDMIEPCLPFLDPFTRSRRRNGQYQVFTFFELLNRLGNNIVRFGTIDGYSPQPFKKFFKWLPKYGLFSHPVYLGPENKYDE